MGNKCPSKCSSIHVFHKSFVISKMCTNSHKTFLLRDTKILQNPTHLLLCLFHGNHVWLSCWLKNGRRPISARQNFARRSIQDVRFLLHFRSHVHHRGSWRWHVQKSNNRIYLVYKSCAWRNLKRFTFPQFETQILSKGINDFSNFRLSQKPN